MRLSRSQAVATAAIIALLALSSAFAQDARTAATAQPDIRFTVSMPRPYTHLLEVEMRVRRAAASSRSQSIDLLMPVWTPGSYLVREFERHVQDFTVADAGGGRALPWRKVNKDTWRIDAGAARELVVTYRVYANEMSVRTNELNDRHAFWNNAALLMYVDGNLNAPATLRINPPPGWKIATGLPALPGGQQNTFRAENFDILYDSPVEVGPFKTLTFEVKGVPHRIVIEGEGNYDAERMRRDVQKIVEAEAAMMGEIPYHDYTFILNLRPSGGGGLEHLNSTALIHPRFGFRTPSDYRDFLALVAHEFFHLWNVKRIRPDALGPFDYTKENYTRLLWVAEGFTSYYENIFLRRAGLISEEDFLSASAKAIQDLQNTPGRLVMSAEEASFDAWIKYYRPDENSVNSQISYYDKGALLGMLLDLTIRQRSNGARSLDDVMRYLYTEYYKKGRNYTPADFQRACELAAQTSLEDFFTRYVRGRDELDYNAALGGVGLRLDTTGATSPTPPVERAYLGVRLKQDNDRLLITRVYAGTPAYDQGLNTDDQIVALDGLRVKEESFNARLAEKRPGDTITLTLFRLDDLRTLQIKLGGRLDAPYSIVPVSNPSADQTRLLQGWIRSSQ
jgi:predicted metalloprotease with PDZ domain